MSPSPGGLASLSCSEEDVRCRGKERKTSGGWGGYSICDNQHPNKRVVTVRVMRHLSGGKVSILLLVGFCAQQGGDSRTTVM